MKNWYIVQSHSSFENKVAGLIKEEADKDYQLAAGITSDVEADDSIWELTKARLPWLLIGMFGGIGAASIINGFSDAMLKFPALLMFIPLIQATAGNHPGVEFYDSTTRKWIIYNDPDDNHELHIKDDGNDRIAITQTGNLKLLADSSVIKMGAGSDITFTHDGTTGLTIAATPISIDSTGELHLNSTTGDIKFQDGGTDQLALDLDGTAGSIIMKLMVDSDDLVFQQYDGTQVLILEDGGTVGVGNGTTAGSNLTVYHSSTAAPATSGDGGGGIMIVNTHLTVDSGDLIGGLGFQSSGNGGSALTNDDSLVKSAAAIIVTASAAHSSTDHQTNMSFYTKSAGTDYNAAATETMRLTKDANLHVDADVTAYSSTTSDSRLKHSVKPLESSLSIITQLNPITYKWKYRPKDTESHIGLIAQEVEKIIPSVIKEQEMPFHTKEGDDTKYKSVRYTELVPHLIGAIKEQQLQIEELKEELKKLKNN